MEAGMTTFYYKSGKGDCSGYGARLHSDQTGRIGLAVAGTVIIVKTVLDQKAQP
jgi:hypothetical protein